MWKRSAVLASALAACALAQGAKHGVGRAPTAQEIRALGSTIGPDGRGLPEGRGTANQGREIFAAKCVRCHREKAEGNIGPILVGGQGTLATAKPLKTVGSFWPHATSVWDYVNRAMPFDKPGALTHSEVYAAVAHLLHINGIIGENDMMNAKTLPKVRMPNRDGFVPDSRPDVK